MAKDTFYITTPIYYPSGNLHIMHTLLSQATLLRAIKECKGMMFVI